MNGKSFIFVCLYGEPVQHKREAFWLNLYDVLSSYAMPLVMMGDFNDVDTTIDRWGGTTPNILKVLHFQNALGLTNEPYLGPLFTWHNGQNFWRSIYQNLDKVVANTNWFLMFPNTKLRNLPRYSSDHSPVILDFHLTLTRNQTNKCFFRFENHWLKESSLKSLVMKVWREAGHV